MKKFWKSSYEQSRSSIFKCQIINVFVFSFQSFTCILAKIEFLDNVAEFFPNYFNETFEATLLRNNGLASNADQIPKVKKTIFFQKQTVKSYKKCEVEVALYTSFIEWS